MFSLPRWTLGSTAMVAFGMTAGAVIPIVISAPSAAASFSDVSDHWARPFIEALSEKNVISGFPDGTFKPNAPVTRAQFAAIVRQAFNQNQVRQVREFTDVPSNYWGTSAIEEAYETGFMSGYPNSQFRPDEEIPKVQVLVSLASGLQLSPKAQTTATLNTFSDASQIPEYAVNGVASATERGVVVNYPNVSYLNPNEVATRGDVAAFIYQALVNKGELQPLSSSIEASEYIVRANTQGNQPNNNNSGNQTSNNSGNQTGSNNRNTQDPNFKLAKGTQVQVKYTASDKVVVTPGETINLTLEVVNDIQNSQGQVLIPKNSKIEGQLVPRYNGSEFLGTQFVAQKLIINNETYTSINATSPLVTNRPTDKVDPGTVKDATASSAARAVLGTILGQQVDLDNVLTGKPNTDQNAQNTQNSVIVIDPEKDLPLTFGSDFFISSTTGS